MLPGMRIWETAELFWPAETSEKQARMDFGGGIG